MKQYRKGTENELGKGSAAVVPWDNGVVFRCPCDERQVFISQSIHKITFDEDGRLTLNGSCGYKARPGIGRPANWCHFWIKGGTPEMCEGAQCPGGEPRT